ncbi:hypothetical protein J5N97_005391 [Dioscorea zingiberensis]|uniref:EF-hand domain-containing protein n=1 Tax=Dioscorea zingiberensis TaxID=325984 RepID=A0A9D5D7Z6_9LILI|nr:hypothetical protein J5N97_005391 [Dioscorea zingiberensis]
MPLSKQGCKRGDGVPGAVAAHLAGNRLNGLEKGGGAPQLAVGRPVVGGAYCRSAYAMREELLVSTWHPSWFRRGERAYRLGLRVAALSRHSSRPAAMPAEPAFSGFEQVFLFNISVESRFASLDTDNNGRLSYIEMMKELLSLRVIETHFGVDIGLSHEELVHVYGSLFSRFDHDGDGTVDLEEFRAEMKEMMLAVAKGLGFLPVQMLVEEGSFLKRAIERERAMKLNA